MDPFETDLQATQQYFDLPRFKGTRRLYSSRQVVEQRGLIAQDYTVAREAAEAEPRHHLDDEPDLSRFLREQPQQRHCRHRAIPRHYERHQWGDGRGNQPARGDGTVIAQIAGGSFGDHEETRAAHGWQESGIS